RGTAADRGLRGGSGSAGDGGDRAGAGGGGGVAGRHGGGPSAGGGGAGSLTRRGGFAARPAGVAGVGRRVRAGLVALAGLWALAAAPVAGQGGGGEVGRGVGGANAGQEAWPAPLGRPGAGQATVRPRREV